MAQKSFVKLIGRLFSYLYFNHKLKDHTYQKGHTK